MQSAMNALNPVKQHRRPVRGRRCGRTARSHAADDPAALGRRCSSSSASTRDHLASYPHQLSPAGMRQRAMIAMALLFTPDLVIMDEPTSALDVVAQRSLMVQIKELQRRLGFAVVFVTHDMSLVSHFSDRLVVMYAGEGGRDRRHPRQSSTARCTRTRRACWTPSRPSAARSVPLTGIPGQSARPAATRRRGAGSRPRCPTRFDAAATSRRTCTPLGARWPLSPAPPTREERWRHDRGRTCSRRPRCSRTRAPHPALQDRRRAVPAGHLHAVDDVELHDRRAGDRRAGRGERQRQEHHRPAAGARLQADCGRDLLPGRPLCRHAPRAATCWPTAADVPMVFQDPFSSLNPAYRVSARRSCAA